MEITEKKVKKMKRMLRVLKAIKFRDITKEKERLDCIKKAEDFLRKYNEVIKND